MATPSSRRTLDKPKIEVTKVLIHHVGKNGEHFYGENFMYEYHTTRHIKPNQHMGILHEFSNCVRETSNHWLSPSDVDWGDPKGESTKHEPNYPSNVKLLCSPTSSNLCDPILANLNQETEFCITKHIPLCDSAVHTGT